MRIDGITLGALAAQDSALTPGVTVRLLEGAFPDLRVGESVTATVLEARAGGVLLDLKGAPVLAGGLPRLPPGTALPLRVTGLDPPVLEAAPRAPTAPALPLTVGEQVNAQVLRQLPNGHLLLDVKGVPLDAAAPPDLPPSANLSLQVVQLRPQVVFQVLDAAPSPEAQATAIVRSHLSDVVPAGESLGTLRAALAGATAPGREPVPVSLARLDAVLAKLVPEGAAPTAERVAALVRDGGLLLEAKLARAASDGGPALARATEGDVKGLVLEALRDLGTAPAAPRDEGLTAALTRHLGHIETQQALHLLARLHGEAMPLQVPFLVGQDFATAFLAVEPDAGGGADGGGAARRGTNILVLLDLDDFGRTRIDAHVAPQSVRVVFYLEREDSLRRVQSEIPEFRGALLAMGYDEVLVAARPAAEMAAGRRQKIDALPLGMPRGAHLIDVRA